MLIHFKGLFLRFTTNLKSVINVVTDLATPTDAKGGVEQKSMLSCSFRCDKFISIHDINWITWAPQAHP